jgi:hypothetical protein
LTAAGRGETRSVRTLERLQAGYYLVTGAWPLVDRRTFEAVTGPKTDFWLVRTVGAVVAAVGAGLALGLRHGRVSDDMRLAAALSAAGLGAVDVVYVARGRISAVYLLDAALEAAFVAAWAANGRGARPAPHPTLSAR